MSQPSKRELERRLEELEEEDAEDAPALTEVLLDREIMAPDDGAEEDGEDGEEDGEDAPGLKDAIRDAADGGST